MMNGHTNSVRAESRKINGKRHSGNLVETVPDLFGAGLDIPYDRRFIRMAQEWAAQAVKIAEGTDTDATALSLVMEEVLDFICRACPDAEPGELIHMDFRLFPDGKTEVTVGNAGPPMHPHKIPEYDPAAPLASDADGLWYFVARKFADDLEFKNMGMGGWRVIIKKRLSQWTFRRTESPGEERVGPPATEALTVRPATPGDAEELMDLTYDTYRYTYPAPELYDAQKLQQALVAATLNSIVVAAGTTIAGNLSYTVNPETPRCAYLCSLMVRRGFRNSDVAQMLLEAQDRLLDTNQANVDLYTVAMVTVHTRSQKIGAKSGFSPMALLLSAGAPARYSGMSIVGEERESFLFCARFARPAEPKILYLPSRHHKVMAPLLLNAGCGAGLSGRTEMPTGAGSVFRKQLNRTENHAYLTLRQPGKNWPSDLRTRLFRLRAQGFACVIVLVPARYPLPPDTDPEMARLNAVFCGVMPTSARAFFLAYAVLFHEIDFSAIQLADPLANSLKDHIHTLYNEVISV